MRQDPDVILVGEVRDLATIRTALRAAETGHLVFTTLHAGDCAGAIERLVSVFPADEQNSARHQLALVLRGIFAQHLLPSPDGRRRPACELLVNTSACANLIATGRTAQIYSVIETGGKAGMRTLDQSLAELLSTGLVDERTALALSRNPDVLKRRLRLC
jgi:twitching motility protein PilT